MKIVLEHLTKRYPNRNRKIKTELTAVDDFTFEIPDGMLIGLLGPSGCGKSTTLNLISGLEPPTSGKIFFGDTEVTNLPPEKRGVGLVFQNYALYPHMTVLENIMFPLGNFRGDAKLSKDEMKKRAMEAADLVQIGGLLERRPSEISGGMKKRAALARAMALDPEVLFFDEPSAGLDPRSSASLDQTILDLNASLGTTIIIVTHELDSIFTVAQRVLFLDVEKKTMTALASPQELKNDKSNETVWNFFNREPF